MRLGRFLQKPYYTCLLASLLGFAGISTATASDRYDLPLAQLQDTTTIEPAGPLPFPFRDQPAFGIPSRDTSKIFLNKPGNINFEI